jgi:hypothetical protein
MNLQRAAQIQVVLEGISLPASRDELVRYARPEDAEASRELTQLPDGDYDTIDAVGEALTHTQPVRQQAERLPKPESGMPPGGDAYLQTSPETGAVRHVAPPSNPPQKTLEQQTKKQKEQKQKQEQD